MDLHEQAIEAELQHMIAIEHGDTALAASIHTAWVEAQAQHTRNARKGWTTAVVISCTLWGVAIVIASHLLTQLVP